MDESSDIETKNGIWIGQQYIKCKKYCEQVRVLVFLTATWIDYKYLLFSECFSLFLI